MGAWTDARVDRLKELWADGLSSSQIAHELAPLGGISRNAVIGKVHRLGLLPREERKAHFVPRPRKSKAPTRRYFQLSRRDVLSDILQNKPAVETNTMTGADIPHAQRKSLLQLTEHSCRWPIGEVGTPGFFFCGAVAIEGWPYCASHCARAYAGGNVAVFSEAAEDRRRYLEARQTYRRYG